jgi:endonuclease YncB( thermonuclease family)
MVTHSTLLARGYRRSSSDYIGEEEIARAGRLGVWAGAFARPWDWRAAKKRR